MLLRNTDVSSGADCVWLPYCQIGVVMLKTPNSVYADPWAGIAIAVYDMGESYTYQALNPGAVRLTTVIAKLATPRWGGA